ncbi:MAG: radical SAM protein, partial [Clostridia bacterium]|nr:radical SAM protein [Clostridia bacterium]
MKNNLSVMLKPASSKCNASCKYCFYRDEVEARTIKDYGNTTTELADIMIEKMLHYVGAGHLSIVFQGGEPTLVGYAFFEHFFDTLALKNTLGANIHLSIQTNGLLIDKKWAKLFKNHNVLV